MRIAVLLFSLLASPLLKVIPAWGVTLATDNFTGDANPIGGNWVTVSGYADLQKLSGKVSNTSTGASAAAYYNTDVANDQWAQITISTATEGQGPFVLVRASTVNETWYALGAITYSGDTYFYLTKKVASVSGDIYFQLEPWVVGDVIRLEVVGSTLRMYRNAAQVGGDQSDGDISAGKFGILIGTNSDASFTEGDDFSAGDFTTGGGGGETRHRVVMVE